MLVVPAKGETKANVNVKEVKIVKLCKSPSEQNVLGKCGRSGLTVTTK